MSRTEIALPALEFADETISAAIRRVSDKETLVVTDLYNLPKAEGAGRAVAVVRGNDADQIPAIMRLYDYSRVTAVGGCAALDIGRACAVGKPIVVVPAILSTSCISLDRSVIKYDGVNIMEKTTLPEKVVICLPDILSMPPRELAKWCGSGFGDLFTMIPAAIDMRSRAGDISYETVVESVRDCFDALEWVLHEFDGYNEKSVRKLAKFLHESSLVVVKRDDSALNSAGEHLLYHALLRLYPHYTGARPTHGQIVAAGTLAACAIYREQTGDAIIYGKVRAAFKKLGLPVNYVELAEAGIERDHLIEGLRAIAPLGSHLGDYFKSGDFSILDRIFSIS